MDNNNKTLGEIVVVDDILANVTLLTEILNRAGFHTRAATDGELALQSIQAKLPDLIILDIRMPGMNGFEVCRRLKADQKTKATPVIFISASTDDSDIVEGFKLGGIDYIYKPFRAEEVIVRAKNQINLQKAKRELEEQLSFVSSLINMIPNPLCFKDENVRYVLCNRSFEQFGQTLEQIKGKTVMEVYGQSNNFKSAEYAEKFNNADLNLLQSDRLTTILESETKLHDGSYHNFVTYKSVLVNSAGVKKGIISVMTDITMQKKEQQHYKSIFENFPALIWMSGEDKLCYYFNKTWLKFTGRSLEDEMGNGWAEGVHPEDFDRCLKIYIDSFEQRTPFDMDYRLKHHSGEYRWISDHGQPFYDVVGKFVGYIGSCYDISETKQRELEMIKLKSAIEQIGTTIVITDTKGRIEYANPYAAKLTGYTIAETLGKNPRIFKSGRHDKAFYDQLWQTITAGKVWRGRFTNKKKNGSFYEEDAIIAPVKNSTGEIVNFVAIKQDITELVSLEEKLRRSQKMEAIGVLAAGIAHEINSPMQYILDNTRFLEDSVKDFLTLINALNHHDFKCEPENYGEIKELVSHLDTEFLNIEIPQAIQENINGIAKIRTIISALKDFSFPRAHRVVGTDINKNLETVLLITANTWKNIAKLDKQLSDELPLIPCYPDELNQVFINLLVNATDAIREKYDKNGIIRVATELFKDCVQISISDNGAGIPENIKNRIFEPFFTTKDVGKGTGQGLAIVYDIIYNLHKGSIEVNSEVGKGTEFVIRLPLTINN